MAESDNFQSAFREAIAAKLHENKPTLKGSSLTTYVSQLYNLHKKMSPLEVRKSHYVMSFFDDKEAIIPYVQKHLKSQQSQKSALAALYNLTLLEPYKDAMTQIGNTINEQYAENRLSERERENKVTPEEIREKLVVLKGALKSNPTAQNYIRYLLLALMGGVYCTSRRNEWGVVKLRNFDAEKDNYYDAKKKQFVFNAYKTARTYGRQTVPLPAEIRTEFNKWVKLNTGDWMFFNPRTDKPLDSTNVGRVLSDIFDRKVGCDMLRVANTTAAYAHGIPSVAALKQRAEEAGHSVDMELQYYKT